LGGRLGCEPLTGEHLHRLRRLISDARTCPGRLVKVTREHLWDVVPSEHLSISPSPGVLWLENNRNREQIGRSR